MNETTHTVCQGSVRTKSIKYTRRELWADNINIDLLETGWGGVDWIGLAQYRDKWRALVNAVMNFRVP
jgi:hypothetical protein